MADLTKLVELSNKYGSDPELVLAGGGNTSYKEDGVLYVKCSGTKLGTITADGFVAMDIGRLTELMDKQYPADDASREAAYLADVMNAVCDEDRTKRPSVEALLHSLFPQKYVLHVHPALINGITCAENGRVIASEILGDDIIWIDICRPGYTLGKLCSEAMNAYLAAKGKPVQIILLQNHGIFIAADTPEEIGELTAAVIGKLEARLQGSYKDIEDELSEITGRPARFLPIREAAWFVDNEENAAALAKPFTPDHIVYCGPFMYFVKAAAMKSSLDAFRQEHGDYPKVVLVEKAGAFAVCDEKAMGNVKLLVNDAMKIAYYARKFSDIQPMTDDLTNFITHWEAESYRKKQA